MSLSPSSFASPFGDLLALEIKGRHLEAHALDYIQKHVISIGAMYRKGARKGWLPGGFRPFASVEPVRLPPKTLTESSLLTDAEVKALLSAADADSFGQMGDMIWLYPDPRETPPPLFIASTIAAGTEQPGDHRAAA